MRGVASARQEIESGVAGANEVRVPVHRAGEHLEVATLGATDKQRARVVVEIEGIDLNRVREIEELLPRVATLLVEKRRRVPRRLWRSCSRLACRFSNPARGLATPVSGRSG